MEMALENLNADKLVGLGLDVANLCVKGASTLSGEDKVDIYISTMTETTETEYTQHKNNPKSDPVYKIKNDDTGEFEYFKVDKEIDDKLGFRQWNFAQKNEVKYYDPYWHKLFLISIYRQVKGQDGAQCIVTTGLPTNDDKRESVKQMLKGVFEGNTFTVNDESFTVLELDFIGQAAATFVNDTIVIDEDGKEQLNKKFLAQVSPKDRKGDPRVIYVDLGWGTADKRLVIGVNVSKDKYGESDGMKFIWRKVIDLAIASDVENEWLLNYEDEVALEGQFRLLSKGEDYIRRDGEECEIRKYYDKVMTEEAENIIKSLYTGRFDKAVYEQIRFTGGGSIPMKPYLEKAIRKYHKGNEARIAAYKFIEDPQATNCRGYLKRSRIKMRKYLKELSNQEN